MSGIWGPCIDEALKARRESIRFLLRELWLSGLRLGEAMSLTWGQWADGIRVDLSGQYAKFLIPAEREKGGQDRVYPVTPDFAEFLHSVPKELREGFVFNPIVSRGVKCGKVVLASAHELRRAFEARWARLVSSMILRDLMRLPSVTTTEKYYVGIQSDETSAVLAALMAKTQTPETAMSDDKRPEQSKR